MCHHTLVFIPLNPNSDIKRLRVTQLRFYTPAFHRLSAGGATNFMRFVVNKHQPLTSRMWPPSPDAEGANGGSTRQPPLIEFVLVHFFLAFSLHS